MRHSPQWYMALGRALGHPGFVTWGEVADAEAELAGQSATESENARRGPSPTLVVIDETAEWR